MHRSHPPGLYSLGNFLLGCRLTLTSRAAITPAQALQELAPAPRRAFGAVATVLFALLAGLALLLAAVRGLGHSAPAAMQQLAPIVSTHGVAVTVAVVVFAAISWAVWRAGRCSANFYGAMCRIGYAHRCEVARRSPTLRCYTRQD